MKLLLRIGKSVVLLAITVFAAVTIAGWLALSLLLDDSAQVSQFEKATLEDMRRVKQLAIEVSQQSAYNETKSLLLNERDINLGIGHFGPTQIKVPNSTYLKVSLSGDQGKVFLSTATATLREQVEQQRLFAESPLLTFITNKLWQYTENKWLNVSWQLAIDNSAEKSNWIQPGKMQLGSISLTQALSQLLAKRAYREFKKQDFATVALSSWQNIKRLDIADSMLSVEFVVPDNSSTPIASYQSLVLSDDEQARIEHYLKLLQSYPNKGPLVKIIAPLFQAAQERSNQSLDPVAENRAVILALSKRYGGDQLLAMLNSNPHQLFRNTPKPYTIYGRKDLAQHLIFSAGLTLIADQRIAELVGVEKELADLYGGRTISAWDLLSDKAGVRLAENATASVRSAREVQRILSKARKDYHLLPDFSAEFEYSEDRFSSSELPELEVLVELYLEQHPALRKIM